jgi:Molecular chaperone (small heat shock protein)
MNLTLKRTMPSLLTDWPMPTTLFGPDFFDGDFDIPSFRLGVNVPSVNVSETPKEFLLELAAPGLERKDFNVEVDNHTLCISAEKKEEKKETEGDYTRKEYSFNSFSRTFSLPENVKEGNIDAKYENGILKVSIPKMKETQVKTTQKISVS